MPTTTYYVYMPDFAIPMPVKDAREAELWSKRGHRVTAIMESDDA